MSDFGKVKDDAEQYAKEHPEQVDKGEQAIEKKLGMNSQSEQTSQENPNTPPSDDESGRDGDTAGSTA
ncbi:MAG: hypothetical protein ACRDOB_06155 [Streptosporangiaceae bacterium]